MTPYEYVLHSSKDELVWRDAFLNHWTTTECSYVNHALFLKNMYGRLIEELYEFTKCGHKVSREYSQHVTNIGTRYLGVLSCLEKGDWNGIFEHNFL